jgi:lysozyme
MTILKGYLLLWKNSLHLCSSNLTRTLATKILQKRNTAKSTFNRFILLFSLLFLGLLLYQFIQSRGANFVRYKEFGIDIPVNYSIHGIDISHHNGTIDWKEVKEMNIRGIKIGFAFIKATEGTNYTDEQFARNWKQSKQYGVTRGAYHFFNENKTGKEQAEHFIKTVGPLLPGDLAPVLDIEENRGTPKEILIKEALEWLAIIEKHYGIKPIVYSYVNFYQQQLGTAFDAYPFWAAHYNEKHQPRTDRNWQLWQHNENGRVNGIKEKVDFNVFKGDLFDFKRLMVF